MYSKEELHQKLDQYRKLPAETEWLEFKEAKNDFWFKDLGEYFSALSNEANLKNKESAWLILGVANDPPRKIVGTHFKNDQKALDKLKHDIATHTNGISFREIYELKFSEGRVLMFQIPPAPAGIPTSWKGHYYGRDGESLGALSLYELEIIRNQSSQEDWTVQVLPDATISDLDETALKTALAKFTAKQPKYREEAGKWPIEVFLDRAKLTRNGGVTRAAILLLGKPEAAHLLSPHPAQITWRLDTEEQAYEHFGPPFLLSVEEIFKRIRNIKFRIQAFNRLIPIELSKYDNWIVLEAINNCIAHQDYTKHARIIVTEKVDRLVLKNIGNFYDGSVEDYVLYKRTPTKYRNHFLSMAMVSLDMIDTMGMGIRKMFFEQRKRFFPLPKYDYKNANNVTLTIYGNIIDENYSKILIERSDLPFYDVFILDKVQKREPISREDAKRLRKKSLVEGRRPNLFVAASIARATGQKPDYTKHKAFDDQYYKDFVIEFLQQHNQGSPQDILFLLKDKLSDLLTEKQKSNKIRNLLQAMSKEGRIRNIGARGLNAKWVLVADDAGDSGQ